MACPARRHRWLVEYRQRDLHPGGSSRTDLVVTAGRTIDATPADTTVTLKLRPQAIYLAFILDDTERGVLDSKKLG